MSAGRAPPASMAVSLPASMVVSLLLTVIFETGFYLIVCKIFGGGRDSKNALLVVLANVLTNPAVVLLYWLAALYTDWNASLAVPPLELSAILVEGYLYKKYGGFRRPYLFSAAANIFSYVAGVLIQLAL